MYQIILLDKTGADRIHSQHAILADAAAVGRKLNAEHRYQYCYIFKSGVGALRPEYC